MSTKVSIIIPLFNREDLIQETLISIQQQTLSDFECIVIDDHSSDKSFEVARKMVEDDQRFTVIKRRDKLKGASVCRNEGIDLATGEFIMFLDSDDLLAVDCFQKRYERAIALPSIEWCVFQVGIFNSDSYLVDRLWSDLNLPDKLNAFINSNGWCISNSFFRIEFIKDRHYFDPEAQSWQDVEFHIRALLINHKIKVLADCEPDVYIRSGSHKRTSNSNISAQRIKNRFVVYKKVEDLLNQNKITSYIRPFRVYYFKYLEIAARTASFHDLKVLIEEWKKSRTCSPDFNILFCTYLFLQSFLSNYYLKVIGSVIYRILHLFLNDNLLYAKQRAKKIPEAIDIRNLVSRT